MKARLLVIFLAIILILNIVSISSQDNEEYTYERVPENKIVIGQEKNETVNESEGNLVEIMHATGIPVHQWIAYQARDIWTTPEITSYILKNDYDDSLDDDGYSSDEGILIGAGEEDSDTTDDDTCFSPFLNNPYCYHFWDPDSPQDGEYDEGLTYIFTYGSSYKRAEKLYNRALGYYNADKDKAYYWLGRVAHLIVDACIPAHVHLDQHATNDDEFEKFLAGEHFNNAWGDGDNYKHFYGEDYEDYYKYENIYPIPEIKSDPTSLFSLFWYTAQKTQYFASDDYDGNNYFAFENGDLYYFPGGSSNNFLWAGDSVEIISNKQDIEDGWGTGNKTSLKKVAEANVPHAMKAVAGLYRLFWIETHDLEPCDSGECCNLDLEIPKENGEQPTGYSDYNFCSGGDIYTKDYYCDGQSKNSKSRNNYVKNCGSDYCDGWQENYCVGKDVYKNRTCYNLGCSSGECFSNSYAEEELVEQCTYGCENGECLLPTLQIISPLQGVYDESRLQFNVKTDEKCDLVYTDYELDYWEFVKQYPNLPIPGGGRARSLCRDCYEYNRSNGFGEGLHYLFVECSDKPEINSSRIFLIDSDAPRISRTYPKSREFTNGSDFIVKYTEDYPLGFLLNVSSKIVEKSGPFSWSDDYCFAGRNKECLFDINLSEFDGGEVNYSFAIVDFSETLISSKPIRINVDTTPPVINKIEKYPSGRRVRFIINITEKNFDKVEYIDNLSTMPRWKNLCARLRDGICEVSKSFSTGSHNLDIRALDKAGNSDIEPLSFMI